MGPCAFKLLHLRFGVGESLPSSLFPPQVIAMNRSLGVMLGSLAVAGILIASLVGGGSFWSRSDNSQPTAAPLLLYCAVANREVIEAIRADYQQEFGREIEIQYGPSQTLLSSIEVSGTGDLYLPADASFLELGKEKSLIEETIEIAKMRAVLVMHRNNPQRFRSFDELLAADVRLVQASPDASAIGKMTRQALQDAGHWEQLDAATDAYRTTVSEVANDVLVGAADVGIVYDAVLHGYPDLVAVELDVLAPIESPVTIGVIASSQHPTAALHFARYVAAKDRGLVHFAEHGFQTQGGDLWSDSPELSLFIGSMLRPAVEKTIVDFEQREGVRVTRVYNGCGILVAQMKSGQRPDAYFACDTEFMDQVVDLFPNPVPVSRNVLVIAVPKGNPKNIRSLSDLTQPGITLGIGHQQQSAMGWLTQNTFRESGLQEQLLANVTMETPSGDMLVNQMQAGSLDAAIVYRSHATTAAEFLDSVPIDGIAAAIATQPWAVSQESRYPQLAERLYRRINSAESRHVFEVEGFGLFEQSELAAND